MASYKDTFEAKTFAANTFGAGNWRGVGVEEALSVLQQCLEQIQDDIQDLDLTGVGDDEIVVKWMRWKLYRFDNIITIHPARNYFSNGRGTAAKDDIGYNCQVSIVYPQEGDEDTALARVTLWHEQIRKKFIHQRLGDLSTVWKCTVHHTRDVPKAFDRQKNIWAALVITPWSRETRG